MDNDKKLAFLQHMTGQALQHVASTPNEPTPDGKMSHDKKLAFVQSMAKHGLQHFDNGGLASVLGAGDSFGAANAPTSAQIGAAAAGTTGAINQQQGYANQAAGQNGFQNQSNVFNQQQGLANQLQNQANGQGPNPAQAALNQQTGQNIAQQAALAAGQRGGGANAGLIARQNAQQGASTQQQAVGQGATLQAQQQLAAENALQTQQSNLQNVAGNQINTQGNAVNALTSGQLQNQQQLLTANSQANAVNASVAQGNQQANSGIIGGLLGAGGTALKVFGAYKGGEVPDHLQHVKNIFYKDEAPMNLKAGGMVPGKSPIQHDDIKNDTVPAMLSKGEEVIDLDTMNDPGPMGKMARTLAVHMKKKKGMKN